MLEAVEHHVCWIIYFKNHTSNLHVFNLHKSQQKSPSGIQGKNTKN